MNIKEIKRKISNSSVIAKSKEYQAGYIAMRDFAMGLLNQLDEPQKPVVPKFVAEWLEKMRKQLVSYHFESGARFMMFIGIDYHQRRGLLTLNEKVRRWLEKDGNEVKLSNAIDYGYEVEKEPLYYVTLPDTDKDSEVVYALEKKRDGGIEISLVDRRKLGVSDSTKLSEQEIKSVDERYQLFAKEVAK